MGEAICVSGDAHNLPTPSLGDKVEPLQKPTKGNNLSFFVVSGFWAQVLGFSMQLSFNFQTVGLGVLYFHGIYFSEYLIKYLKCFFSFCFQVFTVIRRLKLYQAVVTLAELGSIE